MGIVEQFMRKNVRIGQSLDVTLVGGRELRGQLVSFAQDGFLMMEEEVMRPVAFLGVATFAVTRMEQTPAVSAQEKAALAEQEPAVSVPEEIVYEDQDGWIERYESAAAVGSISAGGRQAVFGMDQVLDQQLAEQLERWVGRPIAVHCGIRVRGAQCVATGIVARKAQEKFDKNEQRDGKPEEKEAGERQGFGEIQFFNKGDGYGKASEGENKFLFKREDIVSDALWQEIIHADNTCGIKIAFSVVGDGKGKRVYKNIREIAALHTPEETVKPDFDVVIPVEPEQDVNPAARTTFTDGSELEETQRSGFVMFYNVEKSFGRLQDESDGERYYFRMNDVMQKSLLDYLNGHPLVADTRVTFCKKNLPTGKIAAGKVEWEAPRLSPRKPAAPVLPAAPAAAAKAEKKQSAPVEKKAEPVVMNRYLTNLAKLWNVQPEELSERLCALADGCGDAALRRELLIQNVALSDVRREKRDDAMLRVLRSVAPCEGENQLSGHLLHAGYSGKAMFDALTELFAVSEGALGRICGIVAGDGDLVALRGEILQRLGSVPETAAGLKEAWKPLLEQEREKTNYAALPADAEGLKRADPAGEHPEWAEALHAYTELNAGRSVPAAQTRQTAALCAERIAQKPVRAAVEWLLPVLDAVQEKLAGLEEETGLALRELCAVTVGGVRRLCVEITGKAEQTVLEMDGKTLDVGQVQGSVQAALPSEAQETLCKLAWNGGSMEKTLVFAEAKDADFDADAAVAALEREGVLALVGGGEAELERMLALLNGQEDCIPVYVEAGENTAQLVDNASRAVREALVARCGQDVAGLMLFPTAQTLAGMTHEERCETLLGCVRDFGDMRLLHDKLKGLHVTLLIQAGALAAKTAAFGKDMLENGVYTCVTALRGEDMPCAGINVCADTLEGKLRAAGCTVSDIRA